MTGNCSRASTGTTRAFPSKSPGWNSHPVLVANVAHSLKTKLVPVDPSRPRARSNAEFFGLAYEDLVGSDRFLRFLLTGTPEQYFVVVEEGETITAEMFTDL